MASTGATSADGAARLPHADRRDALLDAAAALLKTGDAEAVSMDAVAERASVSRPLVYKHFANRGELLVSLYERESDRLHAELSAAVDAAGTLADKLRALVRGGLHADAERGPMFDALRASGGRNRDLRRKQRSRDRRAIRVFAAQAVAELGFTDEARAKSAVAMALGAVDSVLVQWRLRPTPQRAAELEDTYVDLVVGGLERLAARSSR